MLRPVLMCQLSIIVPKDQLHNLLSYAGQNQILHLLEVPPDPLPDGVERYEAATLLARASTIRNRVNALSAALGGSAVTPEKLEAPVQRLDAFADFLDEQALKLERSVREYDESKGKLQAEREKAKELARFLGGLESVGFSLDAISGEGFLSVLAGEVGSESVQAIRNQLDEITYSNAIFAVTGSSEKTSTFLAVFPSAFLDEARQAVAAQGASLEPEWGDLPADPVRAKRIVDSRLEQVDESSKLLEHSHEALVKDLAPKVKTLAILSEILELRARAVSGSSVTETTTMLRAWVPSDKVQQFINGANESCEELVLVQVERSPDPKAHSSSHDASPGSGHSSTETATIPPTLVRIPPWAKPLQSIVNNFGMPSYNEMNPLPFMILSYPLIYGLMFGDFGQGPLFILFGLIFQRLKKSGKRVPGGDIGALIVGSAELMILLGIGVTIFGFVFGDFFGFESAQLFGFQPLFSPTEGALTGNISHLRQFMVFVLYFGVAHYTFGLSLNAYMKIRRGERSEAFFGPICWALFYLSLVYLVREFVLAGYDFSAIIARPWAIASFAIPLLLMGWKEGGIHTLEAFTSAGSNTLSYLRIWALNIADFFVKVALFTAGSIAGPAGAIAGAIGGNLLVMIIEGLIVFVQTLRLHWVEWFSKFYEGTGLAFAPYQEPISWIVPTNG